MAKITETETAEKADELIKDIEDLIKEKLGDKTFIKKNPFIDASKPIETPILIDSLPLALKNFGKEEEKNWIFYGPPGTGKTFALNKISSLKLEYVINPDDCNDESPIVMFVKNNIKKNNSEKAIDNYMKILPYCLFYFLAKPFGKSGVNIVFKGYAQEGGGGSGLDRTFFLNKVLLNLIFRKDKFELDIFSTLNDDFTYYPNFEKNFDICDFLILINEDFVARIRDDLIAVCNSIIDDLLSHVTKIVFHPSYTYEDFVGGIKPDLVQTKSNNPSVPLTYKYTPGVMLDLIRKAWGNKGERYYLIIDEFNRGNIAAIFGEFLYLIEHDKRSKDKNSGVHYVFLPGGVYPWDDKEKVEPFSEECKIRMPDNIFIVGALNTADRSIATMDFAMRRRFNFVKFEPNEVLIKGFNWIPRDDKIVYKIEADNYLKILFFSLNKSINYKLDADHEIGHYYLMPAAVEEKIDTIVFLKNLLKQKIVPLLEAYCDHDEKAVNRILELTRKIMKKDCSKIVEDKIVFGILLSTQELRTMDREFPKDSKTEKLIEVFWDLSLINEVITKK